jgi:hypothetical protein
MSNFPPKRTLIKGATYLIDHPLSDPELMGTQHIGKDSWVYEDKKEHSLVLKVAIRWGFDLPDFDTWLDKLEPCVAKDELVERRNSLIHQSSDALRGNIEFLKLRREGIERDEFLVPLALAGKKHKNAQTVKAKSRLGTKNPVLVAIKREMKHFKRDGRTLKEFMASVENGSIENITAKEIQNPHKYIFTLIGEHEDKPRLATLTTISDWWTDCDK